MVVSMRGFHPTQNKRSDFALVRKNGGADAKPCRLRRCDAEQAHSDAFPLWRFFAYFLIVQKVGPPEGNRKRLRRGWCKIQMHPAWGGRVRRSVAGRSRLETAPLGLFRFFGSARGRYRPHHPGFWHPAFSTPGSASGAPPDSRPPRQKTAGA